MSRSRFSLVVLLSAALSLPAIAHIERSEPPSPCDSLLSLV